MQVEDLEVGESLVVIVPDGRAMIITIKKVQPWWFDKKMRLQVTLGFDDPGKISAWRKEKHALIMKAKENINVTRP